MIFVSLEKTPLLSFSSTVDAFCLQGKWWLMDHFLIPIIAPADIESTVSRVCFDDRLAQCMICESKPIRVSIDFYFLAVRIQSNSPTTSDSNGWISTSFECLQKKIEFSRRFGGRTSAKIFRWGVLKKLSRQRIQHESPPLSRRHCSYLNKWLCGISMVMGTKSTHNAVLSLTAIWNDCTYQYIPAKNWEKKGFEWKDEMVENGAKKDSKKK